MGIAIRMMIQAHSFKHFPHRLSPKTGGELSQPGGYVLANRQMRKKCVVLKDHAHTPGLRWHHIINSRYLLIINKDTTR
jgi:hypothetical protein